ncbi:MFS transporter [Pseudomonas sp. NPDC088444]|uniref:MFS transporter n=1 Tax=Pseudomonas sp. NPDC088444 TaxID=3364456 RepID=UPI00384ED26E
MSDKKQKPAIPGSVYILTGCVAVIGCNSLALGPIAPLVSRSLEVTVPTVMTATAAFGLGAAFSALFLAHHIDRFGAYRMLKLAMCILPLALLAAATAVALPVLVLAQLCAGIASGVAVPSIYSNAASLAPPGGESRTIGVVLTGWTLSMVAGVSLSAILADYFGWRAVYLAVALLGVFALLYLNFMKPMSSTSIKKAAPMPLSALNLPGIKPLLCVCATSMAAFYGTYAFLGDYLTHGLGQALSANGLTAFTYGIGFGGAVLFDHAVNRLGAKKALPLALLLLVVIYLLLGFIGTSLGMVLGLMVLLGLGNHYAINLLIVRLVGIDPSKRGSVLGLHSATTNFSVFLGTSTFGYLYSSGGFAMITCAAAALAFLATLASMIPTKRVESLA